MPAAQRLVATRHSWTASWALYREAPLHVIWHNLDRHQTAGSLAARGAGRCLVSKYRQDAKLHKIDSGRPGESASERGRQRRRWGHPCGIGDVAPGNLALQLLDAHERQNPETAGALWPLGGGLSFSRRRSGGVAHAPRNFLYSRGPHGATAGVWGRHDMGRIEGRARSCHSMRKHVSKASEAR